MKMMWCGLSPEDHLFSATKIYETFQATMQESVRWDYRQVLLPLLG